MREPPWYQGGFDEGVIDDSVRYRARGRASGSSRRGLSFAMGSLQGNSWTFATDVGGAKIRNVTKTSGASYTTTTEYAGADGKWVATATGKSTRAK